MCSNSQRIGQFEIVEYNHTIIESDNISKQIEIISYFCWVCLIFEKKVIITEREYLFLLFWCICTSRQPVWETLWQKVSRQKKYLQNLMLSECLFIHTKQECSINATVFHDYQSFLKKNTSIQDFEEKKNSSGGMKTKIVSSEPERH